MSLRSNALLQFMPYNSVLRRYPEDLYLRFQQANNLFTTTIFVLVSAVTKLSRVNRLPMGLRLYRGLGGLMDLPDSFFVRCGLKLDSRVCRLRILEHDRG
jgi:hypothetical protein